MFLLQDYMTISSKIKIIKMSDLDFLALYFFTGMELTILYYISNFEKEDDLNLFRTRSTKNENTLSFQIIMTMICSFSACHI